MRSLCSPRALAFTLVLLVLVTATMKRSVPRAAVSPKETFKSKCSICHATDGSGNTAIGKKLKMRDLRSAEVQKQSDTQLYEMLARGKGKMPGYEKTLGEKKIKELISDIRELSKKR